MAQVWNECYHWENSFASGLTTGDAEKEQVTKSWKNRKPETNCDQCVEGDNFGRNQPRLHISRLKEPNLSPVCRLPSVEKHATFGFELCRFHLFPAWQMDRCCAVFSWQHLLCVTIILQDTRGVLAYSCVFLVLLPSLAWTTLRWWRWQVPWSGDYITSTLSYSEQAIVKYLGLNESMSTHRYHTLSLELYYILRLSSVPSLIVSPMIRPGICAVTTSVRRYAACLVAPCASTSLKGSHPPRAK